MVQRRLQRVRPFCLAVIAFLGIGTLVGCTSVGATSATNTSVRVAYMANLTHAPAILAVDQDYLSKALGDRTKLDSKVFSAGPEIIQALFSGAVDLAFVGPSPTISGFTQSHGQALRIIAGTTSGGAALIVKSGINTPQDLKGKHLATPQLGNTQDVALRAWLKQQNLSADAQGGGDVSITPQENSQTLETFRQGQIDGAWVPEPWASRLVLNGGGHMLVDESSLWPDGKFVTTQLIVRTEFLKDHPDLVRKFLNGYLQAMNAINADPATSQQVVNGALAKLTGKPLSDKVIQTAWPRLSFTVDPVASSLMKSARDAESAGFVEKVNLKGIYDLDLLNAALKAQGKPAVEDK